MSLFIEDRKHPTDLRGLTPFMKLAAIAAVQ
jgi:hypothetical protein